MGEDKWGTRNCRGRALRRPRVPIIQTRLRHFMDWQTSIWSKGSTSKPKSLYFSPTSTRGQLTAESTGLFCCESKLSNSLFSAQTKRANTEMTDQYPPQKRHPGRMLRLKRTM